MHNIEFRHHHGQEAKEVLDDLVDVYRVVYGVEPYAGDPFFSVGSFEERLRGAMDMPGFETVTARVGGRPDGRLVGLVHGVTLPADRAWWVSLGAGRPAAALSAATAQDIFWLRELMVLPSLGNRGIGRSLHDEMVRHRPERWTTLTCIHDNEPARSAYPRWGYQVIGGRIRHAPESPEYDAMLLRPGAVGKLSTPHCG